MTSPNLYHPPIRPIDPFEGVTLFDSYDKPSVVVEDGTKGVTDWVRAEAYKDGTTRVLIYDAGSNYFKTAAQNLRTGYYANASGSTEEIETLLARGRVLLTQSGYELGQFPDGYPEVKAIVDDAQQRPALKAIELLPGKTYLHVHADRLFDKQTPMMHYNVFQHDQTDEPRCSIGKTYLAVHYREDDRLGKEKGVVELLPRHKWKPSTPVTGLDSGIFGDKTIALVPAEETIYDTHYFYELSDTEIENIGALRAPNMDPTVGSEYDKEQTCVHLAITGMQYSRWGSYESVAPDNDKSNDEYANALTELINRFGEERVASEACNIMNMHLSSLHTQAHMPTSPYKPHSDGTPYGKEYMDVARVVTGGYHYVAENMYSSGKWVNFRSLFGDVGFWKATREQFPYIFNKAVDHLLGLPQDFQQHSIYLEHDVTINPIALIRDHFPEAYQEIAQTRPDFSTDRKVAMRVLFGENELPNRRDWAKFSFKPITEITPNGELVFVIER